MTKRFGFTLAEVLITLGIIGVVAAMTMPTLINQTNGAQYKAAYKKALSALSQAVTLNVALDDWSFADVNSADTGSDKKSVEQLLTSRMNIVKTDTTIPSAYTSLNALNPTTGNDKDDAKIPTDVNKYIYLNDGVMFAFKNSDTLCTEDKPCLGFIDVNGLKGPNKVVTCSGTFTAGTPAKDAVTCAEDATDCTPSAAQAATAASCSEVKSPTDIYPVKYYDQTVLPNSAAAAAVLFGK